MLKARMTAEQIELREGLEPTLVANKIANAVALGEGLPETFFDYGCVPQESRAEVYELTKSVKDACGRHLAVIVEIGGTLRRAKELLGHANFLPWLKAFVGPSAPPGTTWASPLTFRTKRQILPIWT